MMNTSAHVVSFDWLEQRLGQPDLRVVDASWYLPAQNRDAKAEFALSRIPGAVHFDIDVIADVTSGLPHTLPSPALFAEKVGELGIAETDTIIVYDSLGMFSAPRVWWMFRVFGATHCKVLDGGFDEWKAGNRAIDIAEFSAPKLAKFNPKFDHAMITGFDAVQKMVMSGDTQLADARGAGRFEGRDPEPRAGMRSGHMPGAKNLPYSMLSSSGHLKTLPELKSVFKDADIDLNQPIVTTCGSGVTAAVITLALLSVGHNANALYDGSWSEWGGHQDTQVVTGPAAK